MSRIVLASASPRRKELLEQIGLEFEICPAKGEEVISKSVPEEVVMAPMDGILVEQVLVNLMENSALHGETTTKIRISVQKLPERVLFCVEDNGKGIDPAILPIIFEGQLPTGDHAASDGKRSMGIGLSVCMSIIQAHQGDMKAENMAAHRGSLIQFWLPCHEENWMEEA